MDKLASTLKQYGLWAGILTVLQVFVSCLYKARVTEYKFDEYMTVVLPLCVITHVILLVAWRMKSDMILCMTILFLFHLGTILQLLVDTNNNEYELLFTNLFLILVAAIMTMFFFGFLNKIEHDHWEKILIISIVLLFVILLIAGTEKNSTKAWILVGGISIQVTELIKLAAIILLAFIYSREDIGGGKKTLKVAGVLTLLGIGFFSINETGTFLVIIIAAMALSFFALSLFEFCMFLTSLLAVLGGAALVLILGYKSYLEGTANSFSQLCYRIWQKLVNRLILTYDPQLLNDPYGIAYQSLTARRILHLSGWWGNSDFTIHLPVAEAEYIPVFLCLKYGLLLLLVVVVAYMGILICSNRIALRQKEILNRLLAIGMSYSLALQSLITIAATCGLLPLSGLPVCFLSNGYTNQCICFFQFFALLKISSTVHKRSGKPWVIRRICLPKLRS